jgi:hypothetical protein
MSHTKEPWRVAGSAFDNEGVKETVIHGLDGRAAIAVTLDFGPNNLSMREDNARRIVACVNACAGIGTEYLERFGATSFNDFKRVKDQRDELLAAMETIARSLPQIACERAQMMDYANKVIASAKGGAA